MVQPAATAAALAVLCGLTAPLASAADTARGNEVFQERCARCHAISSSEPGKRGPHLAGLFQRAPGGVSGFNYRMVFKEAGPVWTAPTLDSYLVIHLLPEQADRDAVIALLKDVTARTK